MDSPQGEIMTENNTNKTIKIRILNPTMGVPITYLDKHNPDQFEVYGATESEGKGFSNGLWKDDSKIAQPVVNDSRVYKRLFIRQRLQ